MAAAASSSSSSLPSTSSLCHSSFIQSSPVPFSFFSPSPSILYSCASRIYSSLSREGLRGESMATDALYFDDIFRKYFYDYSRSKDGGAIRKMRIIIYHQTTHIGKYLFYYALPSPSPSNDYKSWIDKGGEGAQKIIIDPSIIKKSIERTIVYKTTPPINTKLNDTNYHTIVEVVEGDCLDAAYRLLEAGYNPAVLNMASDRHAGGGWRSGAGAQEENIFRRSLYYKTMDAYRHHYPLEETGGIYSPSVLVFRSSEGSGYALLSKPYLINFIAVAACRGPEIEKKSDNNYYMNSLATQLMKKKIRTILSIAINNNHDSIVLSAFGCGAFRCPPYHVALLFNEIINEDNIKNRFKKIIFAIFNDHNANKPHNPEGNIRPFQRVFQKKDGEDNGNKKRKINNNINNINNNNNNINNINNNNNNINNINNNNNNNNNNNSSSSSSSSTSSNGTNEEKTTINNGMNENKR